MLYEIRRTKNDTGIKRKRSIKPWLIAVAVVLGVAVCTAAGASAGKEDFTKALQQTSWYYARSDTRSDTVEGPPKQSNADFAGLYIITLTFQADGTMVASYAPRTGGGDPGIYEYPYTIDDNARALILNDDFEFNGRTYASFVEYTINGEGELESRRIMIDRATGRSGYFSNSSIYTSAVYGLPDETATHTPPAADYGQPEKIATLRNSLDIDAELRLFTGDINSDGFCDVGVLWTTADRTNAFEMQILLNDGKGGLHPGTSQVLGDRPVQTLFVPYPDTMVVVKDLNADGKNDMYIGIAKNDVGGYTGWQNALLLSDGEGMLRDATASLPETADFPHSIASADIDNDGDIDIYVGNIWSSEDIAPYLLINDGIGGFTVGKGLLPAQLRLGENGFTASAFADVNNDSFPDLILGDADDTMSNQYSSRDSLVLLNDGHGKFSLLRNALPKKPSVKSLVLSIVPTDLNSDGWTDLIFVFTNDYLGRYFKAYINNQDGTFRDESSQRLPDADRSDSSYCYRLFEMDADHDGDQDLVGKIWNEYVPTPLLFINDGNGYFTPENFPVTLNTLYFVFLDLDNDGGNDIVYGYYGKATEFYLIRDLTN